MISRNLTTIPGFGRSEVVPNVPNLCQFHGTWEHDIMIWTSGFDQGTFFIGETVDLPGAFALGQVFCLFFVRQIPAKHDSGRSWRGWLCIKKRILVDDFIQFHELRLNVRRNKSNHPGKFPSLQIGFEIGKQGDSMWFIYNIYIIYIIYIIYN